MDDDDYILRICVFLICVLSGIWFYRHQNENGTILQEAFSQREPFVFKEENSVYDLFYINQYDDLYKTKSYSEDDMVVIDTLTKPSLNDNSFLDVGCGSGSLLSLLETRNYNSFGIDKSPAMVNQAKQTAVDSEILCDDVLRDPMLFENNSFSHILCTHFTIYEIEDKTTFFNHCFHWLKPSGFLVLHVVDPDNFNMIVPKSELYNHVNKRIMNTELNTDGFVYTNQFKTSQKEIFVQEEKFQTKNKIRQNSKTWYLTGKKTLCQTAVTCGFDLHSESVYDKGAIRDKNQFLIIFVKPN